MTSGPRGWSVILGTCAVLTAASAAGADESFLTHLTLLDQLTREAVNEMLGTLTVPAGQEVFVLPTGSHEGNAFVADILAGELVRRGCAVRLLDPGSPAPAQVREEPEAPPAPVVPQPSGPDSTATPPDSSWAGAELPDSVAAGRADAEAAGRGAPPDSAPATAGGPADSSRAAAPVAARGQALPPAPRLYPQGRILEFHVLEFGVQYPSVRRRYGFWGPAVVRRIAGVYLQASWIQGPEGKILEVGKGQSHHADVLSGRSVSLAEGASYPFQKPTVQPVRLGRFVEPVAVVGIITSLVYLFYQNQN